MNEDWVSFHFIVPLSVPFFRDFMFSRRTFPLCYDFPGYIGFNAIVNENGDLLTGVFVTDVIVLFKRI